MIDVVPGTGTTSGRPYVGSADDFSKRARTATERYRNIARQVVVATHFEIETCAESPNNRR
jgi:hypothetical protein